MNYIIENGTVKAAAFDFIQRVNSMMAHENPEKKSYFTEKDVPNLTESFGPGVMVIQTPSVPMLFFK